MNAPASAAPPPNFHNSPNYTSRKPASNRSIGQRFVDLWTLGCIIATLGCIIATLGCIIATLAGGFAKSGWLFELLVHFRAQYASILGIGAVLIAARCWRDRKTRAPRVRSRGVKTRRMKPRSLMRRNMVSQCRVWFAVAAFGCCLANVALIAPLYQDRPVSGLPSDEPAFRVLSCNVLSRNQDHRSVLELVARQTPDVAVFIEVTDDWNRALERLKGTHPYSVVETSAGNFGIAIRSKIPIESYRIIRGPVLGKVSLLVRLQVDGRRVTLVATHPAPPTSPRAAAIRNQHMVELAEVINQESAPVVLVGDLNNTSWSPSFQDFMDRTNLRDSRSGFGLQASWPTYAPLLGIPIDHCLVSPDFAVYDRFLGSRVGSDHLPVICDLGWTDTKHSAAH